MMNKQNIHGIVLLNKSQGMSSNRALQKVKHLLCAKKAGHTGALDPLATGLLPLCFGQATKLAEFLLGEDKTYVVEAKLGQRTTTSDSEGDICDERVVPEISMNDFESLLNAFRGEIQQIPSMYSALKFQGKPYYYYARKGIVIERPTRLITIYQCDVIYLKPESFSLRVRCSKGTYIRTLVDDIGEALGCGAHVTSLHRESIDGVHGAMLTLEELEALDNPIQALFKPDEIVHYDTVVLTAKELDDFKIGHLKVLHGDYSTPYLCIKGINGVIYGYATYQEESDYLITKRFIHGFGNIG